MFTRSNHHRNIGVNFITQNLFQQGRFCRDISLNAHYLVTLKIIGDKKKFMYLMNQGSITPTWMRHNDSTLT